MPVPPEYTNALNALKAYRNKILTDMVGARVKAGLDASHDGMVKYSGVIDTIDITPYMFGKVREKALALQLKGMNVDFGNLVRVTSDYTGTKANYPMTPPYKVPQRELPQVDVFVYTPITDLELLDKTNVSALKSALLIQVASDTFRDTPDAENAIYDYYTVYPNYKQRGDWSIVTPDPLFTNITHIRGEYVWCLRELIKTGTYEHYTYYIVFWLDALIRTATATDQTMAVACTFGALIPSPAVFVNVVGQRMKHDAGGVWGSWKYTDALRGFLQLCAESHQLEPYTTVWKNTWKLTMQVNDPVMGYTTPPVGEHEYEATTGVTVTAYPNSGYKFVRWERDGYTCSETNPYLLMMYKDYVCNAVFAPL